MCEKLSVLDVLFRLITVYRLITDAAGMAHVLNILSNNTIINFLNLSICFLQF